MASNPNNKAARLLQVLKSVKNGQANTNIGEAFSKAIEIEGVPSPQPRVAITLVIGAVADLRIQSQSLNGLEQYEEQAINKLEAALVDTPSNETIGVFLKKIDANVFSVLELWSHKIGSHSHTIADDPLLAKLYIMLNDALHDVLDSDLPEELKEELTKAIHNLHSLVVAARLYGNDDINNAANAVYGAAITASAVIAEQQSESQKTVLSKVYQVVGGAKYVADAIYSFERAYNSTRRFLPILPEFMDAQKLLIDSTASDSNI